MRRSLTFIFLLAAMLTSSLAFAQDTDADGDGIGDSRDRCPNSAGPVETMGCPDMDNDGVVDIDDACANVPGIPENRGCPLDGDGDGVGDFEDACPNEAGTAANRGCVNQPDGGTGSTTPTAPQPNPNVPPSDGPCVGLPIFNNRVNVRNAPRSDADVVDIVEPDEPFIITAMVILPGEDPYYAGSHALYQDIIIPANSTGAFDPSFLGGVFVAASVMNVGGDCGPEPIALLLPAVQKVREAAARSGFKGGVRVAVGDVDGDGSSSYLKVKLTDILISSLTGDGETATHAGGGGGGAGKVSMQDFHFLVASVVGGADGDTLVFDLTDVDPDTTAATDFLLEIPGVPGESSDDAQIPPSAASILWMLTLIIEGNNPAGATFEGCNGILVDALRAGGSVEALPTDFGVEFFIRNADGSTPECPEPAADKHKDWIVIESMVAGATNADGSKSGEIHIESFSWGASNAGSLMKIGQGTLILPSGIGIGEDGSICVDLQPEGAAPVCVPNAGE